MSSRKCIEGRSLGTSWWPWWCCGRGGPAAAASVKLIHTEKIVDKTKIKFNRSLNRAKY